MIAWGLGGGKGAAPDPMRAGGKPCADSLLADMEAAARALGLAADESPEEVD